MDKRMPKDIEDALRQRMDIVYKMYLQSLCRGYIVPCKSGVTNIYKSLTYRDYKLKDTFWGTTAIFYCDGSLVAIIAENGVIYSFVNKHIYCPEISCMITQHLTDFIKEFDMHTQPHLIYPKTDK